PLLRPGHLHETDRSVIRPTAAAPLRARLLSPSMVVPRTPPYPGSTRAAYGIRGHFTRGELPMSISEDSRPPDRDAEGVEAPDEEKQLVGQASFEHDPFVSPEEAAMTVRETAPGATDHSEEPEIDEDLPEQE